MIRRCWPWLAAATALAVAACVDVSSPKGVASISALLLPSPSVVIGDVMRDSTGAPAPLRVVAFDGQGQPVAGLTPEFFVLDRGAHVDATGMFFGDSLTTVHVVGTVGGLQTGPATVPVTVAPDSVAKFGSVDTLRAHITGDTTQNVSNPLGVTVTGAGNVGAAGFLVRYRVVYAPPPSAGKDSTVYIGDLSSRPTSVDTTDAAGHAVRRRVVVRVNALGAVLDSVVVTASVQYKGAPLRGSPVRFVIPAKLTP